MAGQTTTKILVLLLIVIVHSQGQICPPGVRTLSCNTITAHNWVGSALTGQCPENNDEITVTSISGMEGDTFSCGIFTVTITAIHPGPVMGTIDLTSRISFTATEDLAGTEVVCEDAAETEIEAFTIRGIDAFPSDADVNVDGLPTYTITDRSTIIEIPMTPIADEILEVFPDAYFSVNYSGSGCGGSSRVTNDVAQVNIGCLEEMNVAFTAVLMNDPNCVSNSTNLPPQSFPLITEPDYTTTVTTTANSAKLSVSMSSMVSSAYIQEDSFDVVGTVSPDGGCTVVTSDTATYPTALFSDLKSETTYSFALRIASKGSDSTVVGRFSGSFETLAPANAGLSTSEAVGLTFILTLVLTALVSFPAGSLVAYYCIKKKQCGTSSRDNHSTHDTYRGHHY